MRKKGRKRELSESGVAKKFTYWFANIKRLTKSSWPDRLCKSCDSQLGVCVGSGGGGGGLETALCSSGTFSDLGADENFYVYPKRSWDAKVMRHCCEEHTGSTAQSSCPQSRRSSSYIQNYISLYSITYQK